MGRFYADITHICTDDLLSPKYLSKPDRMPPVDRDGDIIMTEALIQTTPISPFKEKFNFDWFSFDSSKSPAKKSNTSPVSASSATRKLSISTVSPSSYFNDISPATPSTASTTKQQSSMLSGRRPRYSQLVLPPPPTKPLAWQWQCHICRSRYSLAVTRRCLNDGHYYCSGQTTSNQRNVKRRKANRSCTSEFDYVGWQDVEKWKRKCSALKAFAEGEEEGPILHGCEGCCFPSQCRYESRPKQERLPFDRYIDENDLKAIVKDEVEEMISPEKTAFEEERLLKKTASASKEKHTTEEKNLTARRTVRSDSPSKNTRSKTDRSPSGRQRFYSSLTRSKTSDDSSGRRDAENSSEQGKFDATLPSLSTNSLSEGTLTQEDDASTKSSDMNELTAIEATLKAALAGQQASPSSSAEKQSQKSGGKKRVNSKINDPQFEVPSKDASKQVPSSTLNTPEPQINALQRTTSQQRLLTDFFRQGKPSSGSSDRSKDKSKDPSYSEKARRAASEANIASFLQLKPAHDDENLPTSRPEPTKINAAGHNAQHFEDINLSPSKGHSQSVFTEVLDAPGDEWMKDVDTDPVKKRLVTDESAAGKTASSAPSSLSFLNFGFGRK